MRILFAVSIPFPEGGANTRRIHTIARELVKQGIQVSLLIPFARQPTPKKQIVDGIEVIWCYVPKSSENLKSRSGRVRFGIQVFSRILFLIEFLRLSLRNQYDWVYFYQPFPDVCLAALIAKITRHPICSEYVDLLSQSNSPGLRGIILHLALVIADVFVARLSSVIFVISSILEQRYRQIAPHAQIVLVPTIVDLERFQTGDPVYYRRELRILDSKLVIYIGSLTIHQGVRNLIEAMSLVTLEHEKTHLVIAGGSLAHDRDDVSVLISQFDLAGKATYLGILNSNEVINLLAAADILVAPKLNHPVNHAGFSTKLAEYLAASKPVVVSKVGDIPLYLRHGEHAMLCEPGNVRDLAVNISLLLSNEKLANQIGKQGRELAAEAFSVKKNVANMIKVLGKKNPNTTI